MLTNLVRVCPCLNVGKHVFSGQQPCHSMHTKSGIYAFFLAFEILTREDHNSGDVWEGLSIGKKHKNWWCSSSGWDCDWRESCSGRS